MVLVLIMVVAALVSFGPEEPDVRLLITNPIESSNGELLPCVANWQVPRVELTGPQQDLVYENGNSPIPSSVLTEQ